jgi:3-oxoacyl-[acyl-carrier protein] reductase
VTAGDPGRPSADRPLAGRVALVTGVSRRAGIGMAVARRLAGLGADLFVTSWTAHDRDQPWGADPGGMDAVLAELGAAQGVRRVEHLEADFLDPEAPGRVLAAAVEAYGHVDVLVCNHARSSAGGLGELTAGELDASFAVNTRAVLLLVQAFAAHLDDARGGGRIILFTSGQHLAPMADELPYAISKGAVHQMTRSLADALASRGVTVNAINPGPVDTGWPSPELRERLRPAFPAGRWGRPEDIAAVVRWLASRDGGWVTGQVINAEGGFRRSSPPA